MNNLGLIECFGAARGGSDPGPAHRYRLGCSSEMEDAQNGQEEENRIMQRLWLNMTN